MAAVEPEMHWRTAKRAEIDTVLDALGRSSLQELATAQLSSDEARQIVKDAFDSEGGDAILVAEEIVAILVWQAQDDGFSTSFVSTDGFFAEGKKTVRFGIRYTRDLKARLGGVPMFAFSYSTHARTRQWFKLIGYEIERIEGGLTVYVLR